MNKLKFISKTVIALLVITTTFSCAKEEVEVPESETGSILPKPLALVELDVQKTELTSSTRSGKATSPDINEPMVRLWRPENESIKSHFYQRGNTIFEENIDTGDFIAEFYIQDTSDENFILTYDFRRKQFFVFPISHLAVPIYWANPGESWTAWEEYRTEEVCHIDDFDLNEFLDRHDGKEKHVGVFFNLARLGISSSCENQFTSIQVPRTVKIKEGINNFTRTLTDLNGNSIEFEWYFIGVNYDDDDDDDDDCESADISLDSSIVTWCFLSAYNYSADGDEADVYEWSVQGANIRVGNALVPQGDVYSTSSSTIEIVTGSGGRGSFNFNFSEQISQDHITIRVRAKNNCDNDWTILKTGRRNTDRVSCSTSS